MGLVRELPHDALSADVPVSTLLRKALVVATKLSVKDFEVWIIQELKGYDPSCPDSIPKYRQLSCRMRALNPFYGWQDVLFLGKGESMKGFDSCPSVQSVPEIEHLFDGGKSATALLEMPLSTEARAALTGAMEVPMPVTRFVSQAEVRGILDAVRDAILNWSLRLEQDGILGEDLTFNTAERTTAVSQNYSVNNFFGSASGIQIQQESNEGAKQTYQALDLAALRTWVGEVVANIDSLEVAPAQKEELSADLATVKAQLDALKPKESVIRECLKSVRNILENAVGGVIASGLLQRLSGIS